MMQAIFPECDHSCKNMDRMFFGGKELIYFNGDARMALVQLLHPLLESLDVGKHFRENIRQFAKNANILLLDGHLVMGSWEERDVILGEKMDSAIIHKIGESKKSPFFVVEGYMHQSNTSPKRKTKRVNIGTGETCCQLYNDFREGIDTGHYAKFAIITNFLSINGGRKDFLNTIEMFYGYEACEKWKKDIKYMRGYYPKRCSADFCPYYGTCENVGTIVDTLAMDRKIYREKEEYVSLQEAGFCLKENLYDAFQSRQDGIYLIKAQTGLGKTKVYIDLIEDNPSQKFLIALPTNALKEEVYYKRLGWMPKEEKFMTASIYGNSFFPSEAQDRITGAHARGIHNRTTKIVKEYRKEVKETSYKPAVLEECDRVIEGPRAIKNERVVVTTHAYLTQMTEEFLKNFTVIIDEDILQLQAFNRMNSVSIKCLEELAESGFSFYSGMASDLIHSKEGEYRSWVSAGIVRPCQKNSWGHWNALAQMTISMTLPVPVHM